MDINIIAIILALVALFVTGIGFFASLRFYREGMNLQLGANNALSKISEKADFIHSQVGGILDKTLDAFIGLKRNFEGIDEQLESTADAIVTSALQQIGTAGDEERKRLSDVVNEQMGLIRDRVEETRESAEQFAGLQTANHPIVSIKKEVLAAIHSSKHPLTLEEIVGLTGMDKWPNGSIIDGFDDRLVEYVLNTLSEENRISIAHDPKTNIDLYSPKIAIRRRKKS